MHSQCRGTDIMLNIPIHTCKNYARLHLRCIWMLLFFKVKIVRIDIRVFGTYKSLALKYSVLSVPNDSQFVKALWELWCKKSLQL